MNDADTRACVDHAMATSRLSATGRDSEGAAPARAFAWHAAPSFLADGRKTVRVG